MSIGHISHIDAASLPQHYPFAAVGTATLLGWAHMPEPPYELVRAAAPWLQSDNEVRAYLEGVIGGRIRTWRDGSLFGKAE